MIKHSLKITIPKNFDDNNTEGSSSPSKTSRKQTVGPQESHRSPPKRVTTKFEDDYNEVNCDSKHSHTGELLSARLGGNERKVTIKKKKTVIASELINLSEKMDSYIKEGINVNALDESLPTPAKNIIATLTHKNSMNTSENSDSEAGSPTNAARKRAETIIKDVVRRETHLKLLKSPRLKRNVEMSLNQYDPDLIFELMVYILKNKERSQDQIKFLAFQTENIKFFKEIVSNFGQSYLEKCCQLMTYEFIKKDELVFEIDTLGTNFYIILKGEVSVLVPRLLEKIKIMGSKKRKADSDPFYEVKTLKSGESFGEKALIENTLRAATIKCKADSHFAVLSKSNFKKILMEVEKIKIEKCLDFFRPIPLFKNWSFFQLKKLFYGFELLKFNCQNKVFSEKENAQNVYLIHSGEFLISKDVSLTLPLEKAVKPKDSPYMMPFLSKKKQTIKLAIILKGEIIGDEDIFVGEEKVRSYTLSCMSQEGEVYRMDALDFFFLVKKYEHSMHYLLSHAREKKERYRLREEEITAKLREQENNYKVPEEMPKKFKSLPGLENLPSNLALDILSERGRLKLLDEHLLRNLQSKKDTYKSILPEKEGIHLDKDNVRFFLYKEYNQKLKDARLNKIGMIKMPHFNRKNVSYNGYQTHALISAYKNLSKNELTKVYEKIQEGPKPGEDTLSASQFSKINRKKFTSVSSIPDSFTKSKSDFTPLVPESARVANFGRTEDTIFSKLSVRKSSSIFFGN